MLREVAGYDPDRYDTVADRELREVLFAYEANIREQEVAAYRHDLLMFVLGGTKDKKSPSAPSILKLE